MTTAQKRGPGRPPTPGPKMSEVVYVKLTVAQRRQFAAIAAARSKSEGHAVALGTVIRDCALLGISVMRQQSRD